MRNLNILVFFIVYYSSITPLNAAYCEWGLCKSWEYCCEANTCCDVTNFYTLLLVAVTLAALIVMTVCCACFYCNSYRVRSFLPQRYRRIMYVMMSSHSESESSTNVQEKPNVQSISNSCVINTGEMKPS